MNYWVQMHAAQTMAFRLIQSPLVQTMIGGALAIAAGLIAQSWKHKQDRLAVRDLATLVLESDLVRLQEWREGAADPPALKSEALVDWVTSQLADLRQIADRAARMPDLLASFDSTWFSSETMRLYDEIDIRLASVDRIARLFDGAIARGGGGGPSTAVHLSLLASANRLAEQERVIKSEFTSILKLGDKAPHLLKSLDRYRRHAPWHRRIQAKVWLKLKKPRTNPS